MICSRRRSWDKKADGKRCRGSEHDDANAGDNELRAGHCLAILRGRADEQSPFRGRVFKCYPTRTRANRAPGEGEGARAMPTERPHRLRNKATINSDAAMSDSPNNPDPPGEKPPAPDGPPGDESLSLLPPPPPGAWTPPGAWAPAPAYAPPSSWPPPPPGAAPPSSWPPPPPGSPGQHQYPYLAPDGWPSAPARRRPLRTWLSVVLVVALIGLVLQGTGFSFGGTSTAQPQLGAFSGYSWNGPVTQVSASWTVPAILGAAGSTSASTWIGVQGPQRGAFFQIGIIEETFDGQFSYEAFWSDTAHGFHPQLLMNVVQNDQIHASISESAGSWSARITDLTAGGTQSAPTPVADFSNLNQAEWLQEDPKLPQGPSPYPDIAPTHVSQIEVNGSVPPSADLMPEWMVLPRGKRVEPSPLTDDGFVTQLKK
jgi:hypothetical protein